MRPAGLVQVVDAIGAATGQHFASGPPSGARQPGGARRRGRAAGSRATRATAAGRGTRPSRATGTTDDRETRAQLAQRQRRVRRAGAAHLAIVDDETRLIGHGGGDERKPQRLRRAGRRGVAPAARSALRRSATRRRSNAVRRWPSDQVEGAAEDAERCHAASGTPAMRATRPSISTHSSPRRLPCDPIRARCGQQRR